MSSEDLKLPASLQKLFDALARQTVEDTPPLPVAVGPLHQEVYGHVTDDVRHMQQRLGSYVTKLNRRLKGHKLVVKPGDRKYTYVLTSL